MTGSRQIELLCEIDIEQTVESFHAHAIPENIDIHPGDTILVHGAPEGVPFGEHYIGERRATLTRANALTRAWTVVASIFEIAELFEVGFAPVADAKLFHPKG